MNILLTTDHYIPIVNGIVTHVVLIKEELEKRGHTVSILTASFRKAPQDNLYLLPSIPSFIRPNDPITIPFSKKTERILLEKKFDVIHDHLMLAGFLGLKIAQKQDIPTLLTLHTTFNTFIDWVLPAPTNKLVYPISDKIAHWYLNKHDLIIAPSSKSLKELHRLKLKDKSRLLFNGIHLEDSSTVNANMFREKYNIKKNEKLLTLVGRIDPGKNVDLAVKSIAHVREHIPNVKLAIIGDGQQRSYIQKLITEYKLNDVVVLTGFISRELIASANKAAEAMVFTSDTDNLPTVVIEAISIGKPIIAIKDEAIKDLAIDGKNAFVTEKNEKAFADAIKNLLNDTALKNKFGENSKKISTAFSIEEHVSHLENIYADLQKKG